MRTPIHHYPTCDLYARDAEEKKDNAKIVWLTKRRKDKMGVIWPFDLGKEHYVSHTNDDKKT